MAQWNQISRIAGVQVAAPIAMVGYTLHERRVPGAAARRRRRPARPSAVPDQHDLGERERRHPDPEPASYVYVTPDRVHYSFADNGATTETLPDGSTVTPCPAYNAPADPFSPAGRSRRIVLVEGQR